MTKRLNSTIPYFILPAISAIVFCNTLSNAFVYDDSVTIVNNNLIKEWENIPGIFSFNYFILSGEMSYRPLVTLSYFADYSLWGLNPAGFHLTNLFLHIANTQLFYVFLKRVTMRGSIAFISALLFSTHPILTETVNAISYREDLLAALFFLIAFILFLNIETRTSGRGRFLLYYACSLFSYLLALFSKEMAITLPILLILYNVFYSFAGNPLKSIIKRLKGVYPGYFFITGFYLFIQFVIFRHVYVRLDQTHRHISVMLKVLASYMKLLFLPFGLNADYVVPPVTAGIISFIISALLLATAIIIMIRLCKNNKHHCFLAVWFFIALLPVSNIVTIGNIMAERYLYIPIIGFFGFAGMVVKNCISRRKEVVILFGIMLVISGIMTICRNGTWRDEFTLWHSTAIREPNSARAHHNLGVVHSAKGLYDHADLEYKKTLEINPNDAEAHYNMGNAYERKGLSDNAIREYQEAIRCNPFKADAYNNLGNIYKNRHLTDMSVELYKKAIKCNPFDPNYYNNLGLAYSEKKLYKEAVAEHTKALKISPRMSSSHNNLGNAYKETGNLKDALTEFKTAILLDPANVDVHNNLGITYMNTEQLEDAMEEFKTAIKHDPKLANAHNNLGITYARSGNPDMAIDELNKSVALGLDNADVHNNLAGVYLTRGLTDSAITELKIALKFNPADSNAHCNLGNAYISKQLLDEAVIEFKYAIQYNPADAEIYYYLGNALCRKGLYSEAADTLCQSIQHQPNNPLVHKMIGIIYANYLNNPSKALFHLKESLRLSPDQPAAREIADAIDKLKR